MKTAVLTSTGILLISATLFIPHTPAPPLLSQLHRRARVVGERQRPELLLRRKWRTESIIPNSKVKGTMRRGDSRAPSLTAFIPAFIDEEGSGEGGEVKQHTERPYTNKPEERARKIAKRLRQMEYQARSDEKNEERGPQKPLSSHSRTIRKIHISEVDPAPSEEEIRRIESAAARVHDEGFLTFMKQAYTAWKESGDLDHRDSSGYLIPYHRPPIRNNNHRDKSCFAPQPSPVTWLNVNFYATDPFTPLAETT
eukprot:jgi/Bigna1/79470/fgenesh1_pg.62_\